jgi:hypothetical protein
MVILRPLVHMKEIFNFVLCANFWFYVHEWPADDHVIGRNMWPRLVMYNAISYIDDIRNYLMFCIDTSRYMR